MVEVKELHELIEMEKPMEDKVGKAKEEAQNILKKAHEKAESIIQAVELDSEWEKLKQSMRSTGRRPRWKKNTSKRPPSRRRQLGRTFRKRSSTSLRRS